MSMCPVQPRILTIVTALLVLTVASCRRETSTAKPADAAHGGGRPELRVMSFNLRHETDADDGPRAWRKRIVRIVGMVHDEAPDVIGVQEALQGQAADLRASMPTYAFFGLGRDDGSHAGEFAAIFYLIDRFERDAVDTGTFWLSDTPQVPGSRSWGNQIPRMVTWIRLIDRRTQRGFYVFNTHWDHQHQASREQSALLLADRIAQRRHANDPVLLLGDFNAVTSNPAMGYLLGKRVILVGSERQSPIRLIDAFDTLHARTRNRRTLHFWRGTRDGALKIDHILASVGTEVLAAAIRDQDHPPLSDHFPVTARLILPQSSPRSQSPDLKST